MKKIRRLCIGMTVFAVMTVGVSGCGTVEEKASESKIEVKSRDKKDTKETKRKEEKKEKKEKSDMPALKTDTTIEETVLLDQDGIKITAQELLFKGNSPRLKVLFENNTDKTLRFIGGSLGYSVNAVNGYMFPDMYVNAEVTAGNKATEEISLDYRILQIYGIREIGELQTGFDISDDDCNDILETGPLVIKTSAFENCDLEEDTFKKAMTDKGLMAEHDFKVDYVVEENVYDDGGVTVDTVVSGLNKNNERIVFVEGHNSGSGEVYIGLSDMEINGVVVSEGRWSYDGVSAGKYTVMDIDLDRLIGNEDLNISSKDISTLTFKVGVYDEKADRVASEEELKLTFNDKAEDGKNEGTEVYNQDGIKILYNGSHTDRGDTQYVWYVENTSGQEISVRVEGFSLNKYMVDVFEIKTVEDGKTAVLNVDVSESNMEEIGLKPEDVESGELTLKICNSQYKTVAEPVISIKEKKEKKEK